MSGQAEAVVMAGSITGDVHVHPPASAPAFDTQVRGRCLVGVIPQPAGCFQDRQATAELDALETTDIGSALRGVVLTGTGGVGKTQLAADYARRQWTTGRVEVLVWVTAATTTEIIEAYADAALAFAAAGMGVAVVPAAVKRIDLPDITYRQLTITSGPELLIISRTDELSGPVKAFLSHARKSEPRPPLET
ncbi:hypothetical protein [Actinomadura rayongensis]|uniref:NB-ARC domain-containing protein n=1 Tax=Actinomadura rayongensis TaxID=1429076 RepID=A0A6I4WDJ7_9ACTN|nr:hypothetical protein [Actinomadura rayongensis]MXQ65074.1 hypothetical protein [Actinomadura rayongensis]